MLKPNVFDPVNSRHIYDAIYACLLQVRPKFCLEIGTFHGQSAAVFQYYFDRYCPDGLLVTCDIKKYVELHLKNVRQVIVHPYVNNSCQWHYVQQEELLGVGTPRDNIEIIKQYHDEFDFCFLDGDHQEVSALADLEVCRELAAPPKYILFDDIDEDVHDSKRVYNNIIKNDPNLNIDDFQNWNFWVGAALLWEK